MHEVQLTPKMVEFANRAFSRGRFANFDEMVTAGLRRLNELHGNEPYRSGILFKKNARLAFDEDVVDRPTPRQSTEGPADYTSAREGALSPYQIVGTGLSDPSASLLDPDVVRHVEEEVAAGIYIDIGDVVRTAVRVLMEEDGMADLARLQSSFARSLEGPFIDVTIDELIATMRAGMLDRVEEPSTRDD